MPSLDKSLRKTLESAVKKARRAAEAGARAALTGLGVGEAEAPRGIDRNLRNRLRAHGRQLGDRLDERKGTQSIERLVAECAYEQWHRLLFARFLAENDLLVEPSTEVAMSLAECRELAREKEIDWIGLASDFAQRMLPQIFRMHDPVLEVALPPEKRQELEAILESLPHDVFIADDSLGWVYQFWQSEQKDAVNRSEKKIGADEIAAVTQLFTEDYMVLFLLHNTLGGWWAGRVLDSNPELAHATSEDIVREACALPGVEWKFLRFIFDGESWQPAAGRFMGWPTAREITILDPCMGSGHFLVFALPILAALRAREEATSVQESVDAVLRENLFGLEIDPRCTQIAAFNLALAAWKLAGHRPLPQMQLACSGLAPSSCKDDWLKIAGEDLKARNAMSALYDLFERAPLLGSLIHPHGSKATLLQAGFDAVKPLLERALVRETTDEADRELAVTAWGISRAAAILAMRFTLVTTNVPFLGGYKQTEQLSEYLSEHHEITGGNLANAFVLRAHEFTTPGSGCMAIVTPQDWFLLGRYESLREHVLNSLTGQCLAFLGPHAFETIQGEVVTTALSVWSSHQPDSDSIMTGFDVQAEAGSDEKASRLVQQSAVTSAYLSMRDNPNHRITVETIGAPEYLSSVARPWQGIKTSDDDRFVHTFWELGCVDERWRFMLRSQSASDFSGREHVLLWEDGKGQLRELSKSQDRDRKRDLQGMPAWGKCGIAINTAGRIVAGRYFGEPFASEIVVLTADEKHLPAILAYTQSADFALALKKLDKRVAVTTSTFSQVPFDLSYWQRVAENVSWSSLPRPYSDDPTQWLFDGWPTGSKAPLQVAVARLVGYRWPRQLGSNFIDCPSIGPDGLEKHADDDGIVCLPALRGEPTAADRIRSLLADAYGTDWSASRLEVLLKTVDGGGRSLENWLRTRFFAQHCDLFHQRPFVWHIWDGLENGFGAFVHYHRLAEPNGEGRRTLEKLIYTYIGDWIERQRMEQKEGIEGADARVAAAEHLKRELERILEGEPPYDIFIRWKPLSTQPIGWEPDLDDGVRINIRPFITAKPLNARGKNACILRVSPKIDWEKDRGKEPVRLKEDYPWFWGWKGQMPDFASGPEYDGNRWNDLHYSRRIKLAARQRAEGV